MSSYVSLSLVRFSLLTSSSLSLPFRLAVPSTINVERTPAASNSVRENGSIRLSTLFLIGYCWAISFLSPSSLSLFSLHLKSSLLVVRSLLLSSSPLSSIASLLLLACFLFALLSLLFPLISVSLFIPSRLRAGQQKRALIVARLSVGCTEQPVAAEEREGRPWVGEFGIEDASGFSSVRRRQSGRWKVGAWWQREREKRANVV